jgi:saccharopepsin
MDINSQLQALGQKYMGVRPTNHMDEMFKETSIHVDKDGHPVPVSNFLNAQCKLVQMVISWRVADVSRA